MIVAHQAPGAAAELQDFPIVIANNHVRMQKGVAVVPLCGRVNGELLPSRVPVLRRFLFAIGLAHLSFHLLTLRVPMNISSNNLLPIARKKTGSKIFRLEWIAA